MFILTIGCVLFAAVDSLCGVGLSDTVVDSVDDLLSEVVSCMVVDNPRLSTCSLAILHDGTILTGGMDRMLREVNLQPVVIVSPVPYTEQGEENIPVIQRSGQCFFVLIYSKMDSIVLLLDKFWLDLRGWGLTRDFLVFYVKGEGSSSVQSVAYYESPNFNY